MATFKNLLREEYDAIGGPKLTENMARFLDQLWDILVQLKEASLFQAAVAAGFDEEGDEDMFSPLCERLTSLGLLAAYTQLSTDQPNPQAPNGQKAIPGSVKSGVCKVESYTESDLARMGVVEGEAIFAVVRLILGEKLTDKLALLSKEAAKGAAKEEVSKKEAPAAAADATAVPADTNPANDQEVREADEVVAAKPAASEAPATSAATAEATTNPTNAADTAADTTADKAADASTQVDASAEASDGVNGKDNGKGKGKRMKGAARKIASRANAAEAAESAEGENAEADSQAAQAAQAESSVGQPGKKRRRAAKSSAGIEDLGGGEIPPAPGEEGYALGSTDSVGGKPKEPVASAAGHEHADEGSVEVEDEELPLASYASQRSEREYRADEEFSHFVEGDAEHADVNHGEASEHSSASTESSAAVADGGGAAGAVGTTGEQPAARPRGLDDAALEKLRKSAKTSSANGTFVGKTRVYMRRAALIAVGTAILSLVIYFAVRETKEIDERTQKIEAHYEAPASDMRLVKKSELEAMKQEMASLSAQNDSLRHERKDAVDAAVQEAIKNNSDAIKAKEEAAYNHGKEDAIGLSTSTRERVAILSLSKAVINGECDAFGRGNRIDKVYPTNLGVDVLYWMVDPTTLRLSGLVATNQELLQRADGPVSQIRCIVGRADIFPSFGDPMVAADGQSRPLDKNGKPQETNPLLQE